MAATSAPVGHSKEALPGKPGILVVDDDAAVRQMLEMGLQTFGFQVWVASGGDEAVATYEARRQEISLVLLDVRMPGMDGPTTLRSLQRIDPEICCAYMSGDLGQYSESDLIGTGARCVIEKPFELSRLAIRLHELAGKCSPYANPG